MENRRIGDFTELVRGVSYSKSDASNVFFDDSVALLRANNIVDNTLHIEDVVFVPRSLVSEKQIINKDDIIISMSSGSKSQVGEVAIAEYNTEMAFGAFCGKLIVKEAFPKFCYYFLTSSLFRYHIESQVKGTNINNIKRDYILDFYMPYPSFSEQRRIVSRIEELFSELDNSISTLQKTKVQLKVYRQASITSAYPVMTEENTKKLSEISDITGGITKGRDLKKAETIYLPYLRVANVQNGFLDLAEIKEIELKADEKEKYLLKRGDVLYTEGGDRDKLGRGTVWNEEIPSCVHQNHVFRARVDRSIAIPEYVAYWSMGSYARTYFFRKGKQTVNLASINKTVLSNLELPIPDLVAQVKVLDEIESRLSVCDAIERTVDTALQQAEAMRQSILKQAFEGRL